MDKIIMSLLFHSIFPTTHNVNENKYWPNKKKQSIAYTAEQVSDAKFITEMLESLLSC